MSLIAVLAFLIAAPAAQADAGAVIYDCTDDEVLQGHYTQAELRAALAGLDADADEYTNCRQVIRQAQLAAAGGFSATPAPPSSPLPEPRPDARPQRPVTGAFGGFPAVEADPAANATPREIHALTVARTTVIARMEAAHTRLPTTAIAVLAVGALALLVGVGLSIARRSG